MPLNIQAFYNPATLLLALQSPEAAAQQLANQGVVLGEEDALAIAASTQASAVEGGIHKPKVAALPQGQTQTQPTGPDPFSQLSGNDPLRTLLGGGPPQGQVQPQSSPVPVPPPEEQQKQGLGDILQALQQSSSSGVPFPPPVAPRGGTYTAPNNLIPLLQLGSQQQPSVSALGDIIRNFYR